MSEHDPEPRDSSGRTALAVACAAGDAAKVEQLLTEGANPNGPDGADFSFQIPLHAAAASGSDRCVRLLFAAGAEPRVDGGGNAAVAFATTDEVARALLHGGVEPDRVNAFGNSSASEIAANEDLSVDERVAIVRVLVEAGADLNRLTPHFTAIWRHARDGNGDAVAVLLAAGADPTVEPNALGGACWGNGWSEYSGIEGVVDALIAAGCDVYHRDEQGYTPMHGALMPYNHGTGYASSDGINLPAVKALLRHGATLDIRFSGGYTPLHLAASEGEVEAVQFLLAQGADVRARSDGGKLPVDCARDRAELWEGMTDAKPSLRDPALAAARECVRLLGG